MGWDVAFDNFFRDDRVYPNLNNTRIPFPPSPSVGRHQTSSSGSSAVSIGDPQHSNFNPQLQGFSLQSPTGRQSGYYQADQQRQTQSSHSTQRHDNSSASGELFACRWSGCSKSFNSMNDLVGHVNLSHLRPPNSSRSSRSPLIGQNGIQCQWDNCNIFSPSTAFSGPSAGLGPDALYGMLENHFMREHLSPQHFGASFDANVNSSFSVPQHQQQGYPGPQGGNVPFQVQPQPPHQYSLQGSHSRHSHSQSNTPTTSHSHSHSRGGASLGQGANTTSSPEPDTEVEGESTGPAHDCARVAHVCHWDSTLR